MAPCKVLAARVAIALFSDRACPKLPRYPYGPARTPVVCGLAHEGDAFPAYFDFDALDRQSEVIDPLDNVRVYVADVG